MRRSLTVHAFICALALSLGHAVIAGWNIDHPIVYDEMFHVLAAESLMEEGELKILDGEYTRARLYTHFIAQAMNVCDTSLPCLRATSLLATSLLVALTVLFVFRQVGLPAAVVAGVVLTISPPVIAIAQIIRFYAFHALLFFVVFMLAFTLTDAKTRVGVATRLILLLVLTSVALHLQRTTLIGILGLSAALAAVTAPQWSAWLCQFSDRHRRTAALLVVFGVCAALMLWPVWLDVFITLRTGPLWAEGSAGWPFYYYAQMADWFPGIWPITFILIVAGLSRAPRLVLASSIVLGITFLVLSIAHTKAPRYIAFAMPFFAISVGIGATTLLSVLYKRLNLALRKARLGPAIPIGRFSSIIATGLLSVSLGFYLLAQPVIRDALRMFSRQDAESQLNPWGYQPEWRYVLSEIEPYAERPVTIISSAGVKAAYMLGDFSFDLNASVVRETDTAEEFGMDRRTGRQVVSGPEALRKILESCKPGLALIEAVHANRRVAVPRATIELLDQLATRHEIGNSGLLIWTWDSIAPATADVHGIQCRLVTPIAIRARM